MALEASGFTPWLCEVDIERGANFVAKINEGLAQSDLALLIWSQHAANSAWTLEEWTAALARQVEENRIRLGIVLLRDCPMPLPHHKKVAAVAINGPSPRPTCGSEEYEKSLSRATLCGSGPNRPRCRSV